MKVTTSARIIQNLFIKIRIVNAADRIVLWSQGRLHACRRWHLKRAAAIIGAAWRMKVSYEQMQAKKWIVLRLQSQVRRRNAKIRVDRMRDPFAGFSFVELR